MGCYQNVFSLSLDGHFIDFIWEDVLNLYKFDLGCSFQEHINCTNLDIRLLFELLLSSDNTSLSLQPRCVYEKSVCSSLAAVILFLPHSDIILSAESRPTCCLALCACFIVCNLEPRMCTVTCHRCRSS